MVTFAVMIDRLSGYLKINKTYSVYGYSVIVGIVTGIIAIIFVFLLDKGTHLVSSLHGFSFNEDVATRFLSFHADWRFMLMVILFPALGGLIAGLISYRFSPTSSGTGSDQVIDSFHNKEGNIDTRVPFWKSLATVFTLSSGGSGGKEGPVAYIGAGIGSLVAKSVNAGARARRTLLLAGTAAGLGAVFKAPLGAALTAAEMVYKEDIESDALIPCFISSVTAYIVYTLFAGSGHFMDIQAEYALHVQELPFYILLGILCYPFGYLFIKGFKDTQKYLSFIKMHPVIKPALGGLLVGCISVFFFEVAGTGNDFMLAVAGGKKPVFLGDQVLFVAIAFLIIAFLKIVATTLTIGSGGSAGVFGPSLFIGAMLGAAVGTIVAYLFPELEVSVVSYVVVGMGAFYAGVANAPIAGILMICEMTGTYVLLPPLILASIFTFILSRKVSIYKHQVENRFKSPAHLWDMKLDVMESITISERFDTFRNLAMVKDTAELEEVRKLAAEIEASDFIVVDTDNRYLGVARLRSVDFTNADTAKHSIGDFTDRDVPYVTPDMHLKAVLNIIVKYDADKVAVVSNGKTLGYIRSRDVFHTYSDAVTLKSRN